MKKPKLHFIYAKSFYIFLFSNKSITFFIDFAELSSKDKGTDFMELKLSALYDTVSSQVPHRVCIGCGGKGNSENNSQNVFKILLL